MKYQKVDGYFLYPEIGRWLVMYQERDCITNMVSCPTSLYKYRPTCSKKKDHWFEIP